MDTRVIYTFLYICLFLLVSLVNKYFCEFVWKKMENTIEPRAPGTFLIIIIPLVVSLMFLNNFSIGWSLILGSVFSFVWMVNFNVAEMLSASKNCEEEFGCDSVIEKMNQSIIFQFVFFTTIMMIFLLKSGASR